MKKKRKKFVVVATTLLPFPSNAVFFLFKWARFLQEKVQPIIKSPCLQMHLLLSFLEGEKGDIHCFFGGGEGGGEGGGRSGYDSA